MTNIGINEMKMENSWEILGAMTESFSRNPFTTGLDYNELSKAMKEALNGADTAEEKKERIDIWNDYIVRSANECFRRQDLSYGTLTENRTIFHLISDREQLHVTKTAQAALIEYYARYSAEEEKGKRRGFFGRLFAKTA